MGSPTGFLTICRIDTPYRPIEERLADFNQVRLPLSDESIKSQASRCMDCGVPFCHLYGCPLGNRIPDYADALASGHWREALGILHATNNFPEITGRVCPALCEASCTLAVNFDATACQQVELELAEHGWDHGWIQPQRPRTSSGFRVAIVGSGPAGLASAQQLRRLGHEVVVFEKSDRLGGLLMYGIPNFKLEKGVIDRRLEQMESEGVVFETGTEVGIDISARYMLNKFDAVVIATGTPVPRDLAIPGRELDGIYFAVDYLTQQTRLVLGDTIRPEEMIDPRGKHVVVIGGGDTGADCVGSVLRRGCASVTQVEILPKPSAQRSVDNPWPQWPRILRTSTSHAEGGTRLWNFATEKFLGEDRKVSKVVAASEAPLDADLVLLSLGFLPTPPMTLVDSFSVSLDNKGSIRVKANGSCEVPKVFAAGDAVSGPSLVVRAIHSGRVCADAVHAFLNR